MIGKRADVECILSALDLYIMPSLYEGLPVSLVEAQVNGVPSIVSDSITKEVAFNDNLQYLSINQGYDKWVENALIQIQKPHCANIGVIKDHGFDIRDTADMYRKLIQIGDING